MSKNEYRYDMTAEEWAAAVQREDEARRARRAKRDGVDDVERIANALERIAYTLEQIARHNSGVSAATAGLIFKEGGSGQPTDDADNK